MKAGSTKPVRCAIYTRVSTDQGLEQDFNSLDAQYDASQAYIRSQAHACWTLLRGKYDDGGFSGATLDRPALRRLLADIEAGRIDVVVVYKIDRLTRALVDFAKLVEVFDQHGVTFVSMQAFEWTKLILEGVRPWGNPWGAPQFGSCFFMITGFHGMHVSIGVIYLTTMAIKVLKGDFEAKGNYEVVEIAGLYWHFVDLVWVFIFAFFYLW